MPGDGFAYVSLLATMIGHVFPVYFGFKGTTCFYVFIAGALILNPISTIFASVVGIALLMFTKYKVAAYISIVAIFPIINMYIPFSLFVFDPTTFVGLVNYILIQVVPILMTAIVVIAHISNIKNIINGTEEKFGSKS